MVCRTWRKGICHGTLGSSFCQLRMETDFPIGEVTHGITLHSDYLPLNIAWNTTTKTNGPLSLFFGINLYGGRTRIP